MIMIKMFIKHSAKFQLLSVKVLYLAYLPFFRPKILKSGHIKWNIKVIKLVTNNKLLIIAKVFEHAHLLEFPK